jgi:cytochrome c553
MKNLLILLPLALLLACSPESASTSAPVSNAAPAKLGLCASCHGIEGRSSIPGYPHLAGQDAAYLRAQLLAYRDGSRPHAQMQAIVGVLSEAEIEEMAAWYASRACQPAAAGGP